jgi:ParB family chromosome partitioning protein
VLIPAAKLHPHPGNPRKSLGSLTELAETIRRDGLLQNLTVEPHPDIPGDYRIVIGHRRYAAGMIAGMTDFPCVVTEQGRPRRLMLIENCRRLDLDPVEEALAMGALCDGEDGAEPMTVAQIARETGFSEPTVYERLALLELDPVSQERVRSKDLSASEAARTVRRVLGGKRTQQARKRQQQTAALSWEPDHFAGTHPLARKAAALCERREHGLRRRIGKTAACGACWEQVIRADERLVIEASGRNGSPAVPQFLAP